MTAPTEVLVDFPARLQAAAAAVADARGAYELRLRHRDELVVEAIDDGMHQRAAAEHAGVRPGRISAILANSHRDDDDR